MNEKPKHQFTAEEIVKARWRVIKTEPVLPKGWL